MKLHVITLFPELFEKFCEVGVVGRAIQKKKIQFSTSSPRDFAADAHKSVDDKPFGGGDGMVGRPDVWGKAIRAASNANYVVSLSPRGKILNEKLVQELSSKEGLTFVCGRYAGLDERLTLSGLIDLEISVGDYVVSGGELPASLVMDAVARKIPGVLGNATSASQDSFARAGAALESPLFTQPVSYEGLDVPAILRSGHHQKILQVREFSARLVTHLRRPELEPFLSISASAKKQDLKIWNELTTGDRECLGFKDVTDEMISLLLEGDKAGGRAD